MDILKSILKYIVTFIVLIAIFFGMLTVTSLIPSNALKDNVKESSEVFQQEGEKREFNILGKDEYLFFFTDALMVNTAYSIDSEHPIESFLLARKNYIPGQTTVVYGESQYHVFGSQNYMDENGNVFQTAELYGLMHGEDITESFEYARYWHGYLVILRPLLSIMSIKGIRILNFIVVGLCILSLFLLIRKKCDFRAAIFFIVPLLIINVFVLCLGLSDLYALVLAMIFSIAILLLVDVKEDIGVMFLAFGSITCFIDFLTIPLVTLGLPLCAFFLVKHKQFGTYEKNDLRHKFFSELLTFIVLCYSWAIGYILTWATKWLLVEVILNKDIFSNAIEQIRYRAGGDFDMTYGKVLEKLFNFFGYRLVIGYSLITVCMDLLIRTIKCLKQDASPMQYLKQNIREKLVNIVPFVLVCGLPFMWAFATKQHSAIHAFFVNRIFVVLILGVLMIVYELFSTKPVVEKGHKN